ncbi:MAG: hypothetical protein JSR80_02230 [Verrucomicrobia bacterium]|nr:hypothetical protein [Verrucomicrobiota bacterium]
MEPILTREGFSIERLSLNINLVLNALFMLKSLKKRSVVLGASGLLFCAFQGRKTLGTKALPICLLAAPSLFYVKTHSFGAQPHSSNVQFDFKKFVRSLDPIEGAKVKSLSLPEILPLRAWSPQEQLRLLEICPNLERIDLTSCAESLIENVILALEEHKNLREIFIKPKQYNTFHADLFLTQSKESKAPVLTREALQKHQARFSYVTAEMIRDIFDLARFPQLRYLHIDKNFSRPLTVKELVKQLKNCPHFVSLSVESQTFEKKICECIEEYLDNPSSEHEGLFLLQHLSRFSQQPFQGKEEKFLKALEHLPPSCSVQLHDSLTNEQALQVASKFKDRKYCGWYLGENAPLRRLLSGKISKGTLVNDEDAKLLMQAPGSYEYPSAINCLQEWVSDEQFSLEQLPPRVQFALSQMTTINIDENFFLEEKQESLIALLKKAPHLKKMEILTDVSNDPQFILLWKGFSFHTVAAQSRLLISRSLGSGDPRVEAPLFAIETPNRHAQFCSHLDSREQKLRSRGEIYVLVF